MVVCKFFLQGNCRFGEPYVLAQDDISNELTEKKGRPNWVFTSYGPGKNVPASLLPDNEFSPEELRLRFYEAAAVGKQDQADQEATQVYQKCIRDMEEVRSNIPKIESFLKSKENEHPNRYDLSKIDGRKPIEQVIEDIKAGRPNTNSSFGNSTSVGFGKPAFAQPPSTSSFGQSASTGTFGQPQPASTSFGRPAFGQPGPSTGFGQSGFGAPAFGQPAQSGSTFGKPSGSGFGSSGFGQPAAQPGNVFGKPTAAATATTFGQPAPAFGQQQPSGFGQPAFQAPKSAFGQPATEQKGAFGQPSQPQTGGFGKPAFGQAPAVGGGGFGSGFGAPSSTQQDQNRGLFGAKPTTTDTGPTGFGMPSNANASSTTTGFPSTATTSGPPSNQNTLFSAPPSSTSSITSKAPIHPTQRLLPAMTTQNTRSVTGAGPPGPNTSKKLTMYRGRPVKYLDDQQPCYERPEGNRGIYERIWFPEGDQTEGIKLGGPMSLRPEDTEGEGGKYTAEVENAYKRLYETGTFDLSGSIPEVPPKREWGEFDF
ncbi:MAG: hypothetical protein Q9227_001883 [Pyrenula ochraceoflavens]